MSTAPDTAGAVDADDPRLRVLARVLQDLAFLDLLGPSPAAGAISQAMAVDFRGPRRGTVVVGLPQATAEAVARNLLGLEPDAAVEPALVASAAGELANVVAGNTVPLLAGEGDEVRLGVPRPVPFPHGAAQVLHVATAEGVVSLAITAGEGP